jgi:hypothetical protein
MKNNIQQGSVKISNLHKFSNEQVINLLFIVLIIMIYRFYNYDLIYCIW